MLLTRCRLSLPPSSLLRVQTGQGGWRLGFNSLTARLARLNLGMRPGGGTAGEQVRRVRVMQHAGMGVG